MDSFFPLVNKFIFHVRLLFNSIDFTVTGFGIARQVSKYLEFASFILTSLSILGNALLNVSTPLVSSPLD